MVIGSTELQSDIILNGLDLHLMLLEHLFKLL